MKLTPKFLSLALTAFAATAFISCTNEMNDVNLSGSDAGALKLAKAAKVRAWSGSQDLSTFTRTRNGMEGTVITDIANASDWIKNNKPSDITEEESQYVKEWFSANPGLSEFGFDITNFYLQLVYGQAENITGIWHRYDQNRPKGEEYYDETFIADNVSIDFLECSEDSNVWIHINNFNSNGGGGTPTVYVQNGSALKWCFSVSWDSSVRYYFKAAIIDVPNIGIGYYIGLSIYGEKENNGTQIIGEERLEYAEDWIIKVIPGEGVTPPNPCPGGCGHVEGTCPEECECGCKKEENVTNCPCLNDGECNCGDDCDCGDNCQCGDCGDEPQTPLCPNAGETGHSEKGCGHSHGKGEYCTECGTNGECAKPGGGSENIPGSDTNTPKPSVPSGKTKSEVEVNLSMNDEHVDKQGNGINDLVAKLSIHVRHVGNVEIFIPVGAEAYCDNDDLIILQNHNPGFFEHGGSPVKDENGNVIANQQSVTYEFVEGHPVTLKISYEENGIRITTSGIDDEVFNYLREEFGDGLNFEVLLYFNDTISREDLKKALNRSTIEFLDEKYPDYYINAFKDTVDNPKGKKDCTVTIIEDQSESYSQTPVIGNHLNASEYNQIYRRTGFDGPEGEHDHDFLWKYRK